MVWELINHSFDQGGGCFFFFLRNVGCKVRQLTQWSGSSVQILSCFLQDDFISRSVFTSYVVSRLLASLGVAVR